MADPGLLRPLQGRFVKVFIGGVTDPDGDPVTIVVTGVTQDETPTGPGEGRCPDVRGIGTSTVALRGERFATGDGRLYHISFTASDGQGGMCSAVMTLCVPGEHGTCVDQGPLFDASGPCL